MTINKAFKTRMRIRVRNTFICDTLRDVIDKTWFKLIKMVSSFNTPPTTRAVTLLVEHIYKFEFGNKQANTNKQGVYREYI